MSEEPETFESIVADYGRVVDTRDAVAARAEAIETKAATGLAEFRAIGLRGAKQARVEVREHEADILCIIDRLERLQQHDPAVPRLNDTAIVAGWRRQLREARDRRAQITNDAPATGR